MAAKTPKMKRFFRITVYRGVNMDQEYELVVQVDAAKNDTLAADQLVRQYLPFIKAETAKFIHRFPVEGEDDELGIAMFAFHEAVLRYETPRGAFLQYAALHIRHRLIDYMRKEKRHAGGISLESSHDDEDSRTMLDQLEDGHNELTRREDLSAAQSEIGEFASQLLEFGLSLSDIAENCPKQKRTLAACHQALECAKENPELLEKLLATKRLPLGQLVQLSGLDKKTLERHRKYLVAIFLAYTNGFEIIRGHLQQMSPQKGGRA